MSAAAFFALRFGLFQKVLNQPVQEAGIVGTNGAGKSTLLNVLAGETQPDEGSFFISQDLTV